MVPLILSITISLISSLICVAKNSICYQEHYPILEMISELESHLFYLLFFFIYSLYQNKQWLFFFLLYPYHHRLFQVTSRRLLTINGCATMMDRWGKYTKSFTK